MNSYVIGRSTEEANIVLSSKLGRISRKHAELRVLNDGVMLTDLGSSNGTEVFRDGGWRRIERSEMLNARDRVRFGGEVEKTIEELLGQANARGGSGPGKSSAAQQHVQMGLGRPNAGMAGAAGLGLPLGRPRWLARTRPAPWSRAY